ncbi:MAG TPA: hypothetical protein DCL61_09805 [Cyanobacteria bacterium UBA12227]|nr:hypothetical protein [Cyanobacteria bacterium UBA12227]HAX86476.1 hypothetical protein [Cyanobacteria bacterium UBA11370]HBY76220.1 hypothetical protein [Cyanobacteria bacterium UBA11148]
MANYLTTTSTILCPHGGRANLLTSNTKVFANGSPILLASDIHTVIGCPFTLPNGKPSPCIRIEWSAGSTQTSANSRAPLLKNSIGKCYNAENAIQGVAIIANSQMKASAL